MPDDATSPVLPTSRPAWARSVPRLRARRQLRRRDRLSIELGRAHASVAALTDASLFVELGWTSGRGCTACRLDARGHGGSTGLGVCLVGALVLGSGRDLTVGARVTDLAWHELHRGRPRRTVHWYPAATRQALQAQDLRSWNDHAGRSSGEVAALVRSTLHAARSTLDLARADARVHVGADARG